MEAVKENIERTETELKLYTNRGSTLLVPTIRKMHIYTDGLITTIKTLKVSFDVYREDIS